VLAMKRPRAAPSAAGPGRPAGSGGASPAPVTLRFRAAGEPVSADLSAVTAASDGRSLWLASDETATVERIAAASLDSGGLLFEGHTPFPLHDYLDLPEPRESDEVEADIEGLTIDDGYLWLVGSHSLARKKPEGQDPEEDLDRLTRIKRQANRFLLARIPLVRGASGLDEPCREAADGGRARRAAALKMSKGRNALASAVRKDVHFGPFLEVPAKENGFDIEGIAVRGDQVLLGLRGPVLRGWAMVLDLQVKESGSGHLKLRKLGEGGERYRKHFLDLDGLGVRDILLRGGDALILAGPTMDLDGPVRLYRWRGALDSQGQSAVVPKRHVERVLDLPFGEGFDHAEGITLLAGADGEDALLVVYDSPAPERLSADGTGVAADVFPIPGV